MQEAVHFFSDDSSGDDQKKASSLYSEQAVWLCKNRLTGFNTRINGVLAQILRKYPNDYRLKLLKIKEVTDEQRTPTDQ